MRTFSRLLYITHPNEDFENLAWIESLFDGGIKWIQFRLKQNHFEARNPDKSYLECFAKYLAAVIEKANAFNILVTVNDKDQFLSNHSHLGLHVGKEDKSTKDLTPLLGNFHVFGRTANNFEDIIQYQDSRIDYFGVGPYRFTTTKDKDKLSESLGIEGYTDILSNMKMQGIKTPILAIGGIRKGDIAELIEAGVYGIALSGEIFERGHDSAYIRTLIHEIQKSL